LPDVLAERQWLDLSGHPTSKRINDAAIEIAKVTESYLKATPQPRTLVSKQEAPILANDIAAQVRGSGEPAPSQAQHTSVFVVHGHNTEALARLEGYLSSVGISAVVLSRRDESPQWLFQKFMSVATQARFAIVLLCADDYGASRRQYEAANVGDKALQFRARQNVILELGFFYGRLGFENVFVLHQKPDQVFPNFERPSDLEGVVFDSISDVAWRGKLGAKLSTAGFNLLPSA
jgi:predicted nucleotide-binding protein